MIYSTEFLAKARLQFLEAWIWYEDKQPGLGDRFKEEAYKTIAVMQQNPERYPERKRTYREAPLQVFPYLLIYRVDKRRKTIAIVDVFHTGRNPKTKTR